MRFPSILLAIFCIVLTTSLLARVAAENTNSKIKRKQGAFENRPQFLVEPNNADFPDVQVASRKLRSGWSDAVRLAAYACVLIHEDHPAYRRYFEPGHAAFVKGRPKTHKCCCCHILIYAKPSSAELQDFHLFATLKTLKMARCMELNSSRA